MQELLLSAPARPDIRRGLRYLPLGSYVALYQPMDGGVEIVRVAHGRRDLRNLE